MLRPSLIGSLLAGALAGTLGGCHTAEITLSDNIDLTWDFSFARFDDELHTPYVRGAPVTLFVDTTEEDHSFSGWTVESSDEAIFRVGGCAAGTSLTCDGQAVGEGIAVLAVLDERGRRVGSGTAEVLVPNQVELEAHGYLILGRPAEARVLDVRMIEGGRATYLVTYLREGRELHGNGVLSLEVPAGVAAEPRTSFLFEDREWLTLTTDAVAGTRAFELFADGVSLGSQSLVTVPESDIDRVSIEAQSEGGVSPGQTVTALAQATDAGNHRIFGVDFEWDLDGVEQLGDGDLFRYQFAADQPRMLTARRGDLSDSVPIHASGGSVGSSNSVGCSAAGGGGLASALGLVGLVALGRRLRRRR